MQCLPLLTVVLLALASTSLASSPDTPVVGILGVPTAKSCVTVFEDIEVTLANVNKVFSQRHSSAEVASCFSAFYVKWLEQEGARIIPIPHQITDEQADWYLSHLNGVLFTGGELNLTLDMPYVQTAKKIYDRATASTDVFFPIWGTCQGFQLLNIITAWNTSVLCNECFHGVDNIPLALDLTPDALSSRMFAALPQRAVEILSHENVTQNFHVSGVFPSTHASNPKLSDFYTIMSTNKDARGLEFLSTMESKQFPIYATQWHPERPQFEFVAGDVISHSPDAIFAMQAVAEFFMSEVRKNTNQMTETTVFKDEVSNVHPTNLGQGNLVYIY